MTTETKPLVQIYPKALTPKKGFDMSLELEKRLEIRIGKVWYLADGRTRPEDTYPAPYLQPFNDLQRTTNIIIYTRERWRLAEAAASERISTLRRWSHLHAMRKCDTCPTDSDLEQLKGLIATEQEWKKELESAEAELKRLADLANAPPPDRTAHETDAAREANRKFQAQLDAIDLTAKKGF